MSLTELSLAPLLALTSTSTLFVVVACTGADCLEIKTCTADSSDSPAAAGDLGVLFPGAPSLPSGGGAGGGGASALASDGGTGGGNGGSVGDDPQAGSGGGPNDREPPSGGAGAVTTACDLAKAPSTEACLVSEEFAVFVSPLGENGGAGTRGDPLLGFAEAIALAEQQQKIVVACSTENDVFTAPIALSNKINARVYGGFDCATWTYWHGSRTLVAPAERGLALILEGISGTLTLEDFEFRAMDALDGDGESSVAALVSKSQGVTFRRVLLTAGKGGHGRHGESGGEAFSEAAPSGHDASGETGGGPRTQAQCGCDTGGGRGGDASGSAVDGAPGLPELGEGIGGKGGDACEDGKPGAAGRPRAAEGAATRGKLNGTTWTPSPGQNGDTGEAGQGGGGGGGEGVSGGGAGGGGGCGGCGGKGGKGGGGGGASIGLMLLDSSVSFQNSLVVASDAGRGGDGGLPQSGQAGGVGGFRTGQACLGGKGGTGAPGGPGGGGAGGLSVGILYRGTPPMLNGVSISTGASGYGGSGNQASSTIDDGLDGISPETFGADF